MCNPGLAEGAGAELSAAHCILLPAACLEMETVDTGKDERAPPRLF